MCFIIQAQLPGTKAEEREKLAGLVPGTRGRVEWDLSASKGKPLQLFSRKLYCTCFFVAGDTSPVDRATWPLHADWAPLIADAVSWLYDRAPRGIVLWAVWFGDEPINERAATIDELVHSIEARELSNRTRFLVRKRRGVAA